MSFILPASSGAQDTPSNLKQSKDKKFYKYNKYTHMTEMCT